jgi:xylulokinase
MREPYLLGIDAGTTNCKAFLFDGAGQTVASASAPTPIRRPQPGWAEHDADDLWQVVAGLVRRIAAGSATRPIAGVAVASMAEAGVLVDAAGRALTPMIAWFDARPAAWCERWIAAHGRDTTYAIAGVAPRPIFGAFKLQWLRDQMPDAYRAAARWLHVADYLAFRLCGVAATDYSLATRSMLLDQRTRCWSDGLIARAGLRRELFATLHPAGTRLGSVSHAAAALTGLPAGTPVGVGGHDHVCGALAAGVVAHGACLDSMGTAESAFVATEAPLLERLTASAEVNLGSHVVRDRWYLMRGVSSAGASIEWAGRLLAGSTEPAHVALERLAGTAAPGAGGALFLPRITGGERGGFIGLSADAAAPQLARAVYEGLACEWRRCLGLHEAALGAAAGSITVIGGGARSALWVQIKADVLGRPLWLPDVSESVALGAALLAGMAAGVYADAAAAMAQIVRRGRTVEPDMALHAMYDERYHRVYVPLHPALLPLHRALAD